jgi:cytochrome P450
VAVATSLVDDVTAWATRDPAALADRWRTYARLRDEAPVFRHNDQVLVSRYDDVSAVLLDDVHFKKNAAGQKTSPRMQKVFDILDERGREMLVAILDHRARWISAADDERHTYLRRLGTRIFSARAIAQIEARIDEVADEMLTRLAAQPTCDVISQLAFRLPLTIISEMLDVPEDARERIHQAWVDMTRFEAVVFSDLTKLADGLEVTYEGHVSMERELKAVLDGRRGSPTTPLLEALFQAERDEGVSEPDLIAIVTQLITAGHQTTQDLIGNGLLALFTHRDQWELLCSDPGLVPLAVEEILRYRSPAQLMARTAMAAVDVAAETIQAGEFVLVLLGSANNDSTHFADPDRFDVTRVEAREHLAFSRGVHYCLGAALSRLEMTTVLRRLVARFPDAELAVPAEEIAWMPNTFLLGVESLPVRLGKERGA